MCVKSLIRVQRGYDADCSFINKEEISYRNIRNIVPLLSFER